MTAVPKDQDKKIMVLSLRVGIPIEGFNAQGHMKLAHDYIAALRELDEKHLATTVIDEVMLG